MTMFRVKATTTSRSENVTTILNTVLTNDIVDTVEIGLAE